MSASVGVNVLRWSALGFGLFYGAYHQMSISAREKLQAETKKYEHHQSLIRQAKDEWAKTHPSEQPKPASGAKADPQDPNADLNTILGITDSK